MDESTAIEFGLALVMVLAIFNYLYPGAGFLASLTLLIAFAAVVLLVKGMAEYFVIGKTNNVWAGIIFIMILAVLFNKTAMIIQMLGIVLSLVLGMAGAGLHYIASIA